ncbi:inositol-1-monophosphatase [Candidatus Parabeggiatoa sp. HSG14]|uniref:inositol-1-monophosphatase n=1 Tax=Candidatus Parabeggiatoa sp. HSG14 TaxID=3055593 RepID=UPI0025A69364|nr:inositol-1-monophosphatase [Thiotrichales bacterium HSG14]
MHPMLYTAIQAARRAGVIIIRSIEKRHDLLIESKSKNDFVSEVDRQAEDAIINILRKAYPNHAILAEESGMQRGDDYEWIIDPLDGTTNFLHGNPQFAVSIALKYQDRLDQAVIYDPLRDELYTTSRGRGAFLNERRIRINRSISLEGALLGTGFPFKQKHHKDIYLNTFNALFSQVADIRRAGSAALDLAYLAAGRLDGFWELGLKEWDIAAGSLLIQEAGGLIGDFSGGNNYFETGNIVAGSPKVFKGILQTIQPLLSAELKK